MKAIKDHSNWHVLHGFSKTLSFFSDYTTSELKGLSEVQIIEHDDSYNLYLGVSGFCKSNVSLIADYDHLEIQIKENCDSDMNKPHRVFKKQLKFSVPIDTDNIYANLYEGKLEIFLPKAHFERQIEVHDCDNEDPAFLYDDYSYGCDRLYPPF